jgi:hypothetical protein
LADIQRVGNGGDGVVCRDSDKVIRSIELLDFYEARVLRSAVIDLGAAPTLEARMQVALQRLERVSPRRAQSYLLTMNQFFENAQFLKDTELVDVEDSLHLILPKGCKIEQLVIQRPKVLPGEMMYSVNQDLWDHLDLTQRAGLILHEVVYREAIESAHSDSRAARYLTALIASPKFETISQIEFVELLKMLKFTKAELQGAEIQLFRIKQPLFINESVEWLPRFPEFYPSGVLKSAWSWEGSTLQVSGAMLKLGNEPQLMYPTPGPTLRFYDNGQVQALQARQDSGPFFLGGSSVGLSGYTEFHPEGGLKFVSRLDREILVRVGVNEIPIHETIEFSPFGALLSSRYAFDKLQWQQGGWGRLELSNPLDISVFSLYENGHLKTGFITGGFLQSDIMEIELMLNLDDSKRLSYFKEDGSPSFVMVKSGRVKINGNWKTLKPKTSLKF